MHRILKKICSTSNMSADVYVGTQQNSKFSDSDRFLHVARSFLVKEDTSNLWQEDLTDGESGFAR